MKSAATVALGFPTSLGLVGVEFMHNKAERPCVSVPEEKLSVQVTDVYSVHVDHMDVLEPGECKVREDLAPKTASTNDQDLTVIPQEVLDLPRLSSTRPRSGRTNTRTSVPAEKDGSVRGPGLSRT